jgi:SAM-dependent methyltransferase
MRRRRDRSPRYDADFFDGLQEGVRRSAAVAVPMLVELVGPRSVLDVGCGVGTWLRSLMDAGVTDVLGVDGDYVDRAMLEIPADRFRPVDLAEPFCAGRRFDLALCLEVGEHLDEDRAGTLVASLVAHAPVIAFSAAIPGQGGTHHVNERWLSYWRLLFARHGYSCLDVLRPALWTRREVDSWYAQNMVLFVARPQLDAGSLAEARRRPRRSRSPLRLRS